MFVCLFPVSRAPAEKMQPSRTSCLSNRWGVKCPWPRITPPAWPRITLRFVLSQGRKDNPSQWTWSSFLFRLFWAASCHTPTSFFLQKIIPQTLLLGNLFTSVFFYSVFIGHRISWRQVWSVMTIFIIKLLIYKIVLQNLTEQWTNSNQSLESINELLNWEKNNWQYFKNLWIIWVIFQT